MVIGGNRMALVAAGATVIVLLSAKWRRRYITLHSPGTVAHAIEKHIMDTQVPARSLGIRVFSVDDNSLSLSAPLSDNRNVHGTAFAGSLYAVGVLSAYYLGRQWLIESGLAAAGYEMVARTGHIEYKRPIKSTIVARSVLPAASALQAFRQKLEADGKAFLDVSGHMAVEGDERVHCEYCINVCAFKPRSSS